MLLSVARFSRRFIFSDCSLLQAKLGAHPSKICRAILDGRDILAQGLIHKIGDEETMNIWHHNWIPRNNFNCPITSLVLNPPDRVAGLIDVTSTSWNEGLLRIVFTHFDVEAILIIPLARVEWLTFGPGMRRPEDDLV